MLAVINNEECVRGFTLVGPDRNLLCCASTTEDLRIWSLAEDFGEKKAEFVGLREHPLLSRDNGGGYIIETFHDQSSGQVHLLTGAGGEGGLLLFSVTLTDVSPIAGFIAADDIGSGHTGLIRSAVCVDGTVITAGEDGQICSWREDVNIGSNVPLALQSTAYGPQLGVGANRRLNPY